MRLQQRIWTAILVLSAVFGHASSARALDLDWSGQFRTESHWIYNYSMDSGNTALDATRAAAGGYYIPAGGDRDSFFQTAFLRLRPTVIVNDNIYIKSEWWVGDPIYGIFGNGAPTTSDQRQYYSTQSRGSFLTAQRFWGEFLSDIGTVQVGRVPLHWGLGLFWNSGEGIWDRYMSTGDAIRLISKFGAFTLIPSIVKYTEGNSIGGGCLNPTAATPCSTVTQGGGLSDYSLMLSYDNPDEEIEMGLNFVRRIGGVGQDPSAGYFGINGATAGMSYNVWDIYGRKKIGDFTFAGEVPITTGNIGGIGYNTYAIALETKWDISDSWNTAIKAGHAPGQPNIVETTPGKFRAFYFNPGYKLGLIMFNYQFANFSGPTTLNNPGTSAGALASPFDNPIVNANYLMWSAAYRANRWQFRGSWIYAKALETAGAGSRFYNTWTHQFVNFDANGTGGVADQDSSLGWEMDYGASFFWDDHFRFDLDFGWYFPGDFYRFSNTSFQNPVSSVFATVLKVGVTF